MDEINKLIQAFNQLDFELKLECRQIKHNHYLMQIKGDLLSHNSQVVYKYLDPIIKELEALSHISFDLEEVEYICSSGIALLMKLAKLCEEREIRMDFINIKPKVKSTFLLLGLQHYISLDSKNQSQQKSEDSEENF